MRSVGDHEFETLLLPHLNALFQTALHLTDRAGAETVVQEVYVRALSTLDRQERVDWRISLFTILMRRLKSRRPGGCFSRLTDAELEAVSEEPDTAALSAEQMLSALTRIPLEFGEAILLVDCQAFSYSQAAKILGISKEVVADRVVVARRLLRSQVIESTCPTV